MKNVNQSISYSLRLYSIQFNFLISSALSDELLLFFISLFVCLVDKTSPKNSKQIIITVRQSMSAVKIELCVIYYKKVPY